MFSIERVRVTNELSHTVILSGPRRTNLPRVSKPRNFHFTPGWGKLGQGALGERRAGRERHLADIRQRENKLESSQN